MFAEQMNAFSQRKKKLQPDSKAGLQKPFEEFEFYFVNWEAVASILLSKDLGQT